MKTLNTTKTMRITMNDRKYIEFIGRGDFSKGVRFLMDFHKERSGQYEELHNNILEVKNEIIAEIQAMNDSFSFED